MGQPPAGNCPAEAADQQVAHRLSPKARGTIADALQQALPRGMGLLPGRASARRHLIGG
jgi:hypothetical protein